MARSPTGALGSGASVPRVDVRLRWHTVGSFADLERARVAERFNTLPPGAVRETKKLMRRARSAAALETIAVEGGIAYYQYWSGDIEESTLNEKLEDAAIKAAVVGGGVAVAVLLGSGPGVILAIGIGSYIIADFAVQQWRENTKDRFLTLKDLTDIGVPVDPNISLNVEQWSSQRN